MDAYLRYQGKGKEDFINQFFFFPQFQIGTASNDATVIDLTGKAVGTIEIKNVPRFMNGEVHLLTPTECRRSTFSVALMKLLGLIANNEVNHDSLRR